MIVNYVKEVKNLSKTAFMERSLEQMDEFTITKLLLEQNVFKNSHIKYMLDLTEGVAQWQSVANLKYPSPKKALKAFESVYILRLKYISETQV